MKIYAASLVIVDASNEIDHHIFTFSARKEATSTPEQMAAELAKSLLPAEGEFQHHLIVQDVDMKAHFAQYVDAEFTQETSKEAQ